MRLPISVLALAACALTTPVAAQNAAAPAAATSCRVRMDTAPSAWIIRGYDPYETALPESTFNVTFTKRRMAAGRGS